MLNPWRALVARNLNNMRSLRVNHSSMGKSEGARKESDVYHAHLAVGSFDSVEDMCAARVLDSSLAKADPS